MTKHSDNTLDGQLCLRSHYAAIVEAHKGVEIYQLGDVDCPSCLRRMAEKHEAIAEVFRARLLALPPIKLCSEYSGACINPSNCVSRDACVRLCRVHDTACINPSYCIARDACCAGDPDCVPPATGEEAP